MANRERNNGRRGQTDKFLSVIKGIADVDPNPQDMQRLQGMGAEMTGLQGPLIKEISGWQKEGLGRLIGIPLRNSNGNDQEDDTRYHKMAYVLPLTDESLSGPDQRIVMLFPAAEGPHTLKVLGPKISTHDNEQIRKRENENYLFAFNMLYQPSKKPSLLKEWSYEQGDTAYDSFKKNFSIFDAVDYSATVEDSDTTLREAVATARIRKVRQIQTDEFTLRRTLDPTVVVELDVLSRSWEDIRREENHRLYTQIFRPEDHSEPEAA